MPVYETFSKRQKNLHSAGQPDFYQYENLPIAFRRQVLHIWRDALGIYHRPGSYDFDPWVSPSNESWGLIENTIARESGLSHLGNTPHADPATRCAEHLMNGPTDQVLDVIELSFRVIDRGHRQFDAYVRKKAGISQNADDAISELNQRFQEQGIGYRYENGQIVRIDSDFVHAEVTRPAVQLLLEPSFQGANEEFLRAHEHYRNGRNEEAMQDCLKAFESVIKILCDQKGWSYPARATAKDLIDVIFREGLVPSFLQSQLGALRSILESGVPTVRNKSAGHGQGATLRQVPDYFAAYTIHLTAANILFLVEAGKH